MLVPVIPPVLFLYANEVLESPTFAVVHLLPLITAQVKVVPENSVSIWGSRRTSASHFAITSVRAVLMSFAKAIILRYVIRAILQDKNVCEYRRTLVLEQIIC